jgi:hypothetical protein
MHDHIFILISYYSPSLGGLNIVRWSFGVEQRGSSQEIPRSLHVYVVLCPSDDRFRRIVSTTFYSHVV